VLASTGLTEVDAEGYSALGTLWSSDRENTHLGPALEDNEQFVADAMGHVTDHHVTQGSGTTFPSTDTTGSGYQAGTGRLLTQATIGNTSTTTYTAAGERAVDETVPRQSGGGTFSRYYYRADGLLIAVDHRTCTTTRPPAEIRAARGRMLPPVRPNENPCAEPARTGVAVPASAATTAASASDFTGRGRALRGTSSRRGGTPRRWRRRSRGGRTSASAPFAA